MYIFWIILSIPLSITIREQTIQNSMSPATGNSPVDSFWSMTQLAGNIGYVIMGVLAIGLFLIILQIINLIMDSKASKSLLKTPLRNKSIQDIEKLFATQKDSMLKDMVSRLITFYDIVGNSLNLHEEIVSFVNQKNEKFEVFQNRLHFLSDSAGALGLLGTVWGVFLTFFGGNLDSEKILSGMGVALITTLLGLVVSLIISFLSTEINSFYQKKMETLQLKGDELRLNLFNIDFGNEKFADVTSFVNPEIEKIETEEHTNKKDAKLETVYHTLKIHKKFEGSLTAGRRIRDGIILQVLDSENNPSPNIKIIGKTDGNILFNNGKPMQVLKTNSKGLANFDLIAGEKVCRAKLQFQIEGIDSSIIENEFSIKPADPSKIKIISGNDQAVIIGNELPEKLKIKVEDSFGNSIPKTPITFKLKMGKGAFKNGNHVYSTITDENGVAESSFKLGDITGFHLIEAHTKGINCPPAEFRILGKEHD